MATIKERKNQKGESRYTVEIRLKGFPPQSATFERKTDAKLWAQQTESDIRAGRYFKTVEAKKHTLEDVIKRYKRDVLPHRNSDVTKVGMHLDWWNSHLGVYLLSDITSAILGEYRDRLVSESSPEKKKKSSATVNRYVASLSVTLSKAVEWGWLEENPFSKVRKLTESRGRVRFLSEEEHKDLLRECKKSASPYLYPIVILALSTGARWSEILHLTWKDVELKRQVIHLEKTKNGECRSIPIKGLVLELLEGLNKIRKINTKYVFPSRDGQKPIDIRDAWELALKRAKIEDFHFHDLRHTAASYLAMNGATLYEISTILGHKTLSMVKRYAHLTEQHTADVLERMNRKQFS